MKLNYKRAYKELRRRCKAQYVISRLIEDDYKQIYVAACCEIKTLKDRLREYENKEENKKSFKCEGNVVRLRK